MKVELETKIDFEEYADLCESSDETTFYTSIKHVTFLKDILEIQPSFITVRQNDELIGLMPFFEKKSTYGNVVNSLPFFGSYGGYITKKDCHKEIFSMMNDFNKENDILSCTLITNPFLQKNDYYENFFKFNIKEERRIQCINIENQTSESLWNSFEQRVRRSVRKSMKENIEFSKTELTDDVISDFFSMHKNEMDSKNGKPKPFKFFEYLKNNFIFGKDYDVFVAKKDEKNISYLLICYYYPYAEYYMPAYDSEFKNTQSTSMLIWKSIESSIEKKLSFYNFGGTWFNQPELHRFKRGWAAIDYFYHYYIYADLDYINQIGIEKIKDDFSHFFIAPFNKLK